MKEFPIIMSGHSVLAILKGRKTQTRRVVKPVPPSWAGDVSNEYLPEFAAFHGMHPATACGYPGCNCAGLQTVPETPASWPIHPPYQPGDRLWVREAWCAGQHDAPVEITCRPSEMVPDQAAAYYRAAPQAIEGWRWRSPIHMVRWASRLTLKVTEVRVERLQDLRPVDQNAEGMDWRDGIPEFAAAWDRLNAKRGFSWESNPFVWVISFEVVK